ncbi:hypothetical protein [Streptomyces sp. KL116D]|uniref:hypothetical protein n=1 Tax=Streptomyces sp. KL116D TaxID=3045152 RepID=UPI003558C740
MSRSSCDSRNSTGANRMLLPWRTISPTPQARDGMRRPATSSRFSTGSGQLAVAVGEFLADVP